MALYCYKNWGFCKRVVLECHPICTKLVIFHQCVIHGCTHLDRFVKDYDCSLTCIRIFLCCVYINYWNCLYCSVRAIVWCDVTFLACKIHDDTVGAAKKCARMWINIHCAVDHWSLVLDRYLPLPRLKARNIAPLLRLNPCNASKSAIVSCGASCCDKYAVD